MLVLRDFSKQYDRTPVLSFPELTLDAGVHWIKGENGSGKSTLFKCIAGLVPFEGEIDLNNLSLKKDPLRYRRVVNYAEAEPRYPGFLTAKDLVRFIGKTKGASREQQKNYCETLGIDSFFEKPCETCSSGMLKKISLALAFLGNPKVLILDEPLITLDEQSRKILSELIDQHRKNDIIFLISSHVAIEHLTIQLTSTYIIKNKTLTPD